MRAAYPWKDRVFITVDSYSDTLDWKEKVYDTFYYIPKCERGF